MSALHPYGRIVQKMGDSKVIVMSNINNEAFSAYNMLPKTNLLIGETVKIIQIGEEYGVVRGDVPLRGVLSFYPHRVPDKYLLPNIWGFMSAFVAMNAGLTIQLYGKGVVQAQYGGYLKVETSEGLINCPISPGIQLIPYDFKEGDSVCVDTRTKTVCGFFGETDEGDPAPLGTLFSSSLVNISVPFVDEFGQVLKGYTEYTWQQGLWDVPTQSFVPTGELYANEEFVESSLNAPYSEAWIRNIAGDLPGYFQVHYKNKGVVYRRIINLTMEEIIRAKKAPFARGTSILMTSTPARPNWYSGGGDVWISDAYPNPKKGYLIRKFRGYTPPIYYPEYFSIVNQTGAVAELNINKFGFALRIAGLMVDGEWEGDRDTAEATVIVTVRMNAQGTRLPTILQVFSKRNVQFEVEGDSWGFDLVCGIDGVERV